MPEPAAPVPPQGRQVVVATDLDRSFTREDTALSPAAMARAKQLRGKGVKLVLVTGRPASELSLEELAACFDCLVIEGGAVRGLPGAWMVPAPPPALGQAAAEVESLGHPVRRAWASFSVAGDAEPALAKYAGALVWHRNRDRIDVTSPGVDKGSGLQAALLDLGLVDPWVLAIGDATNDVPLLRAASVGVAVGNAEPELAAMAQAQAPYSADRGFLWAVGNLGAEPAPAARFGDAMQPAPVLLRMARVKEAWALLEQAASPAVIVLGDDARVEGIVTRARILALRDAASYAIPQDTSVGLSLGLPRVVPDVEEWPVWQFCEQVAVVQAHETFHAVASSTVVRRDGKPVGVVIAAARPAP